MDALGKESILLYNVCCSIGLSSSQLKRNIQLADCATTFTNIDVSNASMGAHIICGSQSEGIRLFPMISSHGTSSDIDYICIFGGINVQEYVDTTNTNQAEVLQLLYTDSPEHVLLEVKSSKSESKTFNNTHNFWIPHVRTIKQGKDLVSSSLLNDFFQGHFAKNASFSPSIPECSLSNERHAAFQVYRDFNNTTTHGPAVTSVKRHLISSVDMVCCLRCYEWPTAAHEWIDRARPNGWPSQDLIDQIMNDGCELVPIGKKDHPDEDVQWKLSFARSETRLIRSFNIYQAQCYQLLKIVKSCFISSVVADSLSSYHMKTVMLHTVEQTDPNVWRKDNLAQCFMMCLSNLKRYLTDKILPQYFIVRQNLFEPKVTGDVHQKVLEIVTDLDKIGWKCVLQCPPIQALYWSIQETAGSISYNCLNDVFALEGNKCMIHHLCSALLVNVLTQEHPVSYNCHLLRIVGLCEKPFLKPTATHPSVETARVLQLLRKSELGLLLTGIRAMTHPDRRPGIEPLMNFARKCLEDSCHADVSSCRLKLATFFFHLREYDRCIAAVQDVLERFKDVWIVVGGLGTNVDEIKKTLSNMDTSTLEFKLNRVLQLLDNGFPFISNHWSLPAFFTHREVAVAPKGVQFLHRKMRRPNVLFSDACCCIDSIVYAHYLLLES